MRDISADAISWHNSAVGFINATLRLIAGAAIWICENGIVLAEWVHCRFSPPKTYNDVETEFREFFKAT